MLQLHFEIGFVRHFNYCYTLKRKEIDTKEKKDFCFLKFFTAARLFDPYSQ